MFAMSSSQITVHWEGLSDAESGVDRIEIGVGSTNISADVVAMFEVSGQSAEVDKVDAFKDGHRYYVLLTVITYTL